jgi:hypothetical protein
MLVLKSDRSSGNVGVGVEVGSDVIGQAVSVEPVDDGCYHSGGIGAR